MHAELEWKLRKIFDCVKGVEKIVLVNTNIRDPNFTYLTGFRGGLYENNVLIARRNGLALYTNELEYETAKSQSFRGLRIVCVKTDELRELLDQEIQGRSIGINGNFLPYSKHKAVEQHKPRRIVDIAECLAKARLVKSRQEMESIRKAVQITKTAMKKIQAHFKAEVTEKGLARVFDDVSAELGSEGPSFPTIVAFGKNAALPHYSPSSTRLKRGDFLLIDAGARFNNYCGDITRTFFFKGADKKKQEVYDTVKEAHDKAIAGIRPGRKAKEIDALARSHIDAAHSGRYRGTFIHTLGHSLGIEDHDGYRLSKEADVTLEEGMVFTVEPGIYINGFGGVRIEDDLVVTKKGCKVL